MKAFSIKLQGAFNGKMDKDKKSTYTKRHFRNNNSLETDCILFLLLKNCTDIYGKSMSNINQYFTGELNMHRLLIQTGS